MATKTVRKVTLSLDASLVERVQQAVKEGEAKSQTEFFEVAALAKLREIRREKRRQLLLEASRDPVYLAEIDQLEKEFAHADAEAARMIE